MEHVELIITFSAFSFTAYTSLLRITTHPPGKELLEDDDSSLQAKTDALAGSATLPNPANVPSANTDTNNVSTPSTITAPAVPPPARTTGNGLVNVLASARALLPNRNSGTRQGDIETGQVNRAVATVNY
jgi:hypothetical protein